MSADIHPIGLVALALRMCLLKAADVSIQVDVRYGGLSDHLSSGECACVTIARPLCTQRMLLSRKIE